MSVSVSAICPYQFDAYLIKLVASAFNSDQSRLVSRVMRETNFSYDFYKNHELNKLDVIDQNTSQKIVKELNSLLEMELILQEGASIKRNSVSVPQTKQSKH